MGNLKNLSKEDFNVKANTVEAISTSALMRIADATEAMSVNHVKLQNDYDFMRKQRDEYRNRCNQLEKKISNLKGQITKLRNKNEVLKKQLC